jgi:hypothetical protein
MLNVGINLWRTSITHGGAIAPDFPPNVSGTQATIAADFVGNQYWAAGASKASFAAWMTAIGGTYTRSSSATYLQGGVVKTATANTPRFPTSLAGVAQGLRLTGAATNVQTQSSDFSQAVWAPQSVTMTTGQPDPAGGATATKFISTVVTANFGLSDNINPGFTATPWTVSIFAKNAGYNFLVIDINNFGQQQASFNLTTGATAVTGSTVTAGTVQLANGWWLCWMTATSGQVGNWPPAFMMESAGTLPAVPIIGDGVSGIYMWGAQITNTAFPVDYIPTTTVTVTQATDSFIFPYTQTTYSALLNTNNVADINSSWLLNYTPNAPILANTGPLTAANYNNASFLVTASPGGSWNSAHKTMIAGNPTSRKIVIDAGVVAADANAFGPASSTMAILTGGTQAYGNVQQLAFWNGLVASNAEMQRLTAPPPPTIANASISADFVGNAYAVAGVSKANFAAWLAAIGGTYSRSSSATYLQGGVVKTATANTPRFPTDAGGAAQGIRLTGAATNFVLKSIDLTDAVQWIKGANVTVATGAPDPTGGNNAQTITATADGVYFTNNYVFGSFTTGAQNQTITTSLWMRRRTGSGPVSLSNTAGQNNVPVTSTWQKFSLTATQTTTSAAFLVDVLTAGDQVDVWNAQITKTAFPTDDIPTTTATVTQAADTFSFPFTQTTFSVLAGVVGQAAMGGVSIIGTQVENPLSHSDTQFYTSPTVILPAPAFAGSISNPHKVMLAGSPTGRRITNDGAVPASDANPIITITPTTLYVGQGSTIAYGNFSQLALWNNLAASAADMQRLTT